MTKGTLGVYTTSLADRPVLGGKCTKEHVIFLNFSIDGHKIRRLEEMLDSGFFLDFFPKLREHISGGKKVIHTYMVMRHSPSGLTVPRAKR